MKRIINRKFTRCYSNIFLLNREEYVYLQQDATLLEEISIKEHTRPVFVDERRNSFNFKNFVLGIVFFLQKNLLEAIL